MPEQPKNLRKKKRIKTKRDPNKQKYRCTRP